MSGRSVPLCVVVSISGRPLFLSTVGLLLFSHSFSVLCHSYLSHLAFTGFLWFIRLFVWLICACSAPPPTLSCCSSIWRGVDPSPGQVPGADGEPESEASWLRLQAALWGLLTEVIVCLSLIFWFHSKAQSQGSSLSRTWKYMCPSCVLSQQQDKLDVAKLFTKDMEDMSMCRVLP